MTLHIPMAWLTYGGTALGGFVVGWIARSLVQSYRDFCDEQDFASRF